MTMIIHKKYLPDVDIDTSSFIYEWDYILIRDEYICDVLKCMNVPEIGEDYFCDICDIGCFKDYPEVLEYYALKSAQNAYYYARYVLKGGFKLGENIIATNAEYSYRYAHDVLRGRFELGEPTMTTNDDAAYWYARDVIRGRFELGEKVIMESQYARLYRHKFLAT